MKNNIYDFGDWIAISGSLNKSNVLKIANKIRVLVEKKLYNVLEILSKSGSMFRYYFDLDPNFRFIMIKSWNIKSITILNDNNGETVVLSLDKNSNAGVPKGDYMIINYEDQLENYRSIYLINIDTMNLYLTKLNNENKLICEEC